ncbi:MAG: hypothetical protein ABIL78_01930 [candidate division WOR-3 bacterium]
MKNKRKNKRDRELEELKQLYEKNIEAIRELRKLIEEDRKRAEEDRKKAEEYEKQREKEHKEAMERLKRVEETLDRLAKEREEDEKRRKEYEKQREKEHREAMERLTKLEETTRNLSKSITDLNGIWSDYTEKIILDGFENAAKEYGLEIIQLIERQLIRRGGDNYEIDGLAIGKDFVIVIETKTKFRKEDFEQLENNLNRFFEFYPFYRGYKLYGAIAGIRITENIRNLAEKKGFFVIEHKDGKDVKILNSKNFKPKDFSNLNG